ncbi:NusG domain II-containing protein [Treponema sp.]|uniref:NusG domain II-containing protein n=1 Tax=Treponema sp. TaxID=166 RepID=UPI00298DE16E|nr:NusG domain II-containing protein [Treponema sp.]MCQ2242072.1 NusG domain II-containing protein [Treponema sp.]
MKIKVRIFDFFIFLVFASTVAFSTVRILSGKSTKKTLIVQTRTDKYAYSLDKDLNLEFEGLIGKSRIAVSDGKAWFEDSPCENKICVESGKINGPNQWAACLPNGIIIYIEGETEKEEVDVIAN